MNKLFSRVLVGALAITMATGSAYGAVSVGTQPVGPQPGGKASLDYEKGQAIVLYKPSSAGVSAKSVDDEYEIADTKEFVTGESSGESAGASEGSGAQNSEEPEFSAEALPEGTRLKFALVKSSKLSTAKLIKKLKATGDVLYAAPNIRLKTNSVSNDMTGKQWALKNTGQNGGTPGVSINADAEWTGNNNKGSQEKVVAVVDTGIDYTNPDLVENMWVNPYQPKLKGKYGYDFENGDDDPLDDNGHGSHCAGIIGADDDGNGITGICPDVSLMALKILDEEGSSYAWNEIAAYEYISKAQDLGVNVVSINNSYGVEVPASILEEVDEEVQAFLDLFDIFKAAVDTVGAKGAVTVAAAGNSGVELAKDAISYPAQVDSDYIVVVGAGNENDELAGFSNYGQDVDVVAPGTDILSTVSSGCYNPGSYDKARQDACSDYYADFSESDAGWDELINNTDSYVEKDKDSTTVSAEITDEKFFGDDNGKSFRISVHTTGADTVKVKLPVFSVPELDYDKQSKILSMMVTTDVPQGSDISGELHVLGPDDDTDLAVPLDRANYWDRFEMMACKSDGKACDLNAIVEFKVASAGDCSVYIDDYGISKVVDDDKFDETFGKYDFYNGTSMAAPYVTGEAALLASAKTAEDGAVSYDAYETIDGIYSRLRKADFGSKIIDTSSSIDLSKNNPVQVTRIGSVALNAEGKVELSGRLLGNVNKVEVKKSSAEDSEYKDVNRTVNKDGSKAELAGVVDAYPYTAIDVRVTYDNDKVVVKKNIYIAKANKYTKVKDVNLSTWSEAVTDGVCLYTLEDGSLMCTPIKGNPDFESEPLYTFYSTDSEVSANNSMGALAADGADDDSKDSDSSDMSAYYTQETMLGSNIAYLDGKIYAIVNDALTVGGGADDMDIFAKSSDSGFYNEYSLVEIDLARITTDIKYKPKTVNLDKSVENLDDITLAGYNGKLMLIGGYDYKAEKPSTNVSVYSPDNGKWEAGAALPDGEGRADGYALQTDSGLVYTLGYAENQKGVETDKQKCPVNLIYDGKKWTASAAQLIPYAKPAVVKKNDTDYNTYYGSVTFAKGGLQYIATPAEGLGDSFTFNVANDSFTLGKYNMTTDLAKYQGMVGVAVGDTVYCQGEDGQLYTFKTQSGFYQIKDLSSKGGVVNGANRPVVPGDKVKLTASAKKGYFVKTLYVNGKKAKGKSATIRVIDNKQTAKSVAGKYVDRVKLNKTKLTLKAGKTYKLKATVYPKDAGNRAVRYTTSNKRYATVSKTGKVKALKAGKGKTVTIKAIAKDGSGKKAACKVKIK